jgi:hypothetical protein
MAGDRAAQVQLVGGIREWLAEIELTHGAGTHEQEL